MSWQSNLRKVVPYVAGEQPKLDEMIKLNTNENPYPPSPKVTELLREFDANRLRLYPNADAEDLKAALAEQLGVSGNQIFIGNGSDEVLALSFLTFFNSDKPLLMPDISYSFYPIYCDLYGIPFEKVPVAENFEVDVADYERENGGIAIANPNAPTSLALGLSEIEQLLKMNPDSVVLIDEAYVDFGGQTVLPLLDKYDNLVIIRTFSKSRSLAGIRLGVALGSEFAIARLHDVKNSINSYPIDRLAQAIGVASVKDEAYFEAMLDKVIKTRQIFMKNLRALGFEVLDSKANFVFASHPKYSGQELFDALYAQKIIVRHWNAPRIENWLRITIGTDDEMQRVIDFLKGYCEENA